MDNIITLSHGSGGEQSNNLIKKIFIDKFNNKTLNRMNDSAILEVDGKKLAFTTDSYVINPLFFPGGDIGRLAVCGTVNDLSMVGAKPIGLSCGFIIEEGLQVDILEKIVNSMKEACNEAGVEFVTGDTKVVNRGAADKLFINTSGIGIVDKDINIAGNMAGVGDKIIVSGNIGNHGAAILVARDEYGIEADIQSDVAPLNQLVSRMLSVGGIKVLRDPTRGGLGTTLNEIAEASAVEIEIEQSKIPIQNEVKGICNLLGLDPLYLANEGKLVAFVDANRCEQVLGIMKTHKYGKDACIIGEVKAVHNKGRVYMKVESGSSRIVGKLVGDSLPRIC